jgi:hypothetical protein
MRASIPTWKVFATQMNPGLIVPVVIVPEVKVFDTGVCKVASTSGIRRLTNSGRPPPHQRIYLRQHCQLIMHRAGCRDRGSRHRYQTRSWASKINASLGMPGNTHSPTVLLAARAIFKAQSHHCYLARNPSSALSRNPGWRNSDHFAGCSNFEQSLLKMMTRRKRWSNSAGSD